MTGLSPEEERETHVAASNQGVPNYGIADDYPLLWERAQQYDFAERLGGCTDPLLKEIDVALRECWEARRAYIQDGGPL